MTWNYRIIKFAEHRALHEVYYDDAERPERYTENAVRFECNTDESLIGDLELALRDVRELPILSVETFDLPIEQRPTLERRRAA